jgi:putative flippase GtrA
VITTKVNITRAQVEIYQRALKKTRQRAYRSARVSSPANDPFVIKIRRVEQRSLPPLIVRYGTGSIATAVLSLAVFAATLGWGDTNTTAASAAAIVGGAVSNYMFNRHWARRASGGDRVRELLMNTGTILVYFVVAAAVTDLVRTWSRHLTADPGWQVALTTAAFLVVTAVVSVAKFLIYERLVFARGRAVELSSVRRHSLRADDRDNAKDKHDAKYPS